MSDTNPYGPYLEESEMELCEAVMTRKMLLGEEPIPMNEINYVQVCYDNIRQKRLYTP